MRIAYLSGAYIPSRGANSMHVMRMCQAMARLGHEVTLHVRPGEALDEDDFVHYGVDPCFHLLKTRRPNLGVWGAVVNAWLTRKAVMREEAPDLVYAREFWALMLLAGSGVPFVFESHWRPKSWFHKAVERYIMRQDGCRKVVVISDELRKIYENEFPDLPRKKLCVAHDAADPIEACSTPTKGLGGRTSALQVGYVGSFQTGAGVEMLADLALKLPEMDFHVIGGGPVEVREFAARYAGRKNLHCHGFVPPRELPTFYAAIDVAIAPYQASTRSIGWMSPMKLFEYMAYGKAIVCSDFPVVREIITDGENGSVVHSSDIDAWRDALLALADSGLRRRLGRAAKDVFMKRFTWARRAEVVLGDINLQGRVNHL